MKIKPENELRLIVTEEKKLTAAEILAEIVCRYQELEGRVDALVTRIRKRNEEKG